MGAEAMTSLTPLTCTPHCARPVPAADEPWVGDTYTCPDCGAAWEWDGEWLLAPVEEGRTPTLDSPRPTPAQLSSLFSNLVDDRADLDGLSVADVVHLIVEDVLDSVRLAITEGPIIATDQEADDVIGTVKGYYVNHYGDL